MKKITTLLLSMVMVSGLVFAAGAKKSKNKITTVEIWHTYNGRQQPLMTLQTALMQARQNTR